MLYGPLNIRSDWMKVPKTDHQWGMLYWLLKKLTASMKFMHRPLCLSIILAPHYLSVLDSLNYDFFRVSWLVKKQKVHIWFVIYLKWSIAYGALVVRTFCGVRGIIWALAPFDEDSLEKNHFLTWCMWWHMQAMYICIVKSRCTTWCGHDINSSLTTCYTAWGGIFV